MSDIEVGSAPFTTTSRASSRFRAGGEVRTDDLWVALLKFAAWLRNSGYASYDPYDVQGTSYGRFARRLYYKRNPAGSALMAPLILMEIVCPSLRSLFVKKDRFPTADAQVALAFLNLYDVSREAMNRSTAKMFPDSSHESWLAKAETIADELLAQSVPGYSGHCWGYPFDWQNVAGLMPKDTPHITATPYCYEAFARLFDVTGKKHYLEIARSITAFVSQDINDTPTGPDSAASSYTPYDHGKVVNASAYRAFVLFDAARRFQSDEFRVKAWRNLRFILENQHADGSWLYAIDNPDEAFIDNFHTCFVLKNLYKINLHLNDGDVGNAIQRGYDWYRSKLFDAQDQPKSFAIAHRFQIVRLEMYNVAEAITLGVLLRNDIQGALALAERLADRSIRRYTVRKGHWVTRVYFGGIKHTVPFLRWPQSQLFLALTNLLAAKIADAKATSQAC